MVSYRHAMLVRLSPETTTCTRCGRRVGVGDGLGCSLHQGVAVGLGVRLGVELGVTDVPIGAIVDITVVVGDAVSTPRA